MGAEILPAFKSILSFRANRLKIGGYVGVSSREALCNPLDPNVIADAAQVLIFHRCADIPETFRACAQAALPDYVSNNRCAIGHLSNPCGI
jgi:hypothetical protein